jgi:hypothetical protein
MPAAVKLRDPIRLRNFVRCPAELAASVACGDSRRNGSRRVGEDRGHGSSDLARLGASLQRRWAGPGFEKLLAAICEGRVGAAVSIEASRLARKGRDWHMLVEFCGFVGT